VTSFNKVVGPRTTEEGFEEAQEIYEGRMVEGVGGGTCQVASTVHAAAFLGGLEILEDYRHSRPSAYIPMGLDATVVWPTLDLKLRNPYPFPVVFDVVVEKNRLTVALRGAARPAKVTWSKKVLLEIPFEEAVETDDELPAGSVVVAQEGINGYKIEKTRVIALDGGGETTETTVDFYPPTTRIVTIAPGATYAPAAVAPAPAATGDTAVPP